MFFRVLRESNKEWESMGLRRVGYLEWTWLCVRGWLYRLPCLFRHDYEYDRIEELPEFPEMQIAWFHCKRCWNTSGALLARAEKA